MSSYFHICICSGLKSTDSWSNTIKANVTPTITSVNALRCAYWSTDNNSSNVLWSLMLVKVPLCCGWVCMRQRNMPQHVLLTFSKWNVCFAASCLLNQNWTYIYTSLICIYIQGRCRYCGVCFKPGRVCCAAVWKQHHYLMRVCCCNKPATLSFGANPTTTVVACLTESPKGAYFLLISLFIIVFLTRNLV